MLSIRFAHVGHWLMVSMRFPLKIADRSTAMPRQTYLRRFAQARASRLFQAGLIALFWLLGEGLVKATGIGLPGGIVGMAIVLALLSSGWLKPQRMRRGAQWYLGEMLLFFIPAVLALLDHREFIGLLGLKLGFVILGGTVVVLMATALSVDLTHRILAARIRQSRHDR